MSLINQMLKDLDERRGPANGAHAAALHGLGLAVTNSRCHWHHGLAIAAWGLGGILAIATAHHAISRYLQDTKEPVPPAAVTHSTTSGDAAAPENTLNRGGDAAQLLAAASAAPELSEQRQAQVVAKDLQPEAGAKPATPEKRVSDMPAPRNTATPLAAEAPRVALSNPVKTLTPQQRAERYFTKAQQALAQQQHKRGESLLEQALGEFPRHVAARTQLAALLLSEQRSEEAEQLLAEGLTRDAHRLELARPYARLLAERGALVAALETLDGALRQSSPDSETLALQAAILYRSGRHAESAAAYQQALQVQPHRALWWTGLAVALEHNKQPSAALEAYQRAAQLQLEQAVQDFVQQRIRALRDTEALY